MDKFILKEKLTELLKECTVKSALFYTFNFDPRFFENYIMPLLVSGSEFNEEVIHNKILWRKYQKDGLIPPITVYCDYFAKDSSAGPTLGYDVFCVRMPFVKGKICNFHPKHIIIELVDGNGVQKLLFFTGSGNLTTGGWCDNFEVFSIEEITKNRDYPKTTNTNFLQEMLLKISSLHGSERLSLAEQNIYNFLKYVDLDAKFKYHYSGHNNFQKFLEENIFDVDSISEIEIISPYFSNNINLLNYLKSFGNPQIKILIPTLKSNEVLLKEDMFNVLKENGATWSRWNYQKHNEEVRNLHAKMYRFYGKEKVYTIVGSVNFTEPAWGGFDEAKNESNMESAMLYVELHTEDNRILTPEPVLQNLMFFDFEDPESNEDKIANRSGPNVAFTIDWKAKTLSYIAETPLKNCRFEKILAEIPINKGTYQKQLSADDLKLLTGNTIIELSVIVGTEKQVYTYYPAQENIENKPLDFKLSVLNVLDYWNFLGNDYYTNRLSRKISETVTDGSGIVREELMESKSILNEMATYFNSFIKLERYLFRTANTIEERKSQFRDQNYYLLTENIDTISYCLKSLEEKVKDGDLKSLYWMILQILINNFYEKAKKHVYGDVFKDNDETVNNFKKDLQVKINELKNITKRLTSSIEGLKEKESWVIKELKKNYV